MDKITLYPSNWLYNAGVVGFLRVLEKLKIKYEIEEFIKIELDGLNENKIENKIFEIWDKLTKEKLNISYKGKSKGTQTYYYSNQTERSIKEMIKAMFSKKNKQTKRKKNFTLFCSFCNDITYVNEIKELKQTFGNILLGSEKSFPNTYWMMKSREFVCPRCSFILMCHHIPFVLLEKDKDTKTEIFINTPHFNLTYDLNKFAEEVLKEKKQYEIRKLLGSSLLQWAIKRRVWLGAWTMMNVEIVVKRGIRTEKNKWEPTIDYFDFPYHMTKILLDYEIANLISRIGEEKIFDLIVMGKFSEFEKANYFVLRGLLKLKNNEKIAENDPITKYIDNYENKEHLLNISNLLPELYAKIIKILKREVKYG
ncbi:MAG: hypothetical protein NC926_08130 [Candidatus Omnitrophica bacterium]|nr:hypothetical protein [Candidatus Omnitrophota bacterium]